MNNTATPSFDAEPDEASGRQARALASVARARMKNAWLRAGACAVTALAVSAALGNAAPLIWFAGLAVVLFIDHTTHAHLHRACPANHPPPRLWALLVWTATQSAYANILALMLWFADPAHGETLAMMFLMGGLANAAATLRSSPALFYAGAGPTIAALLGLPLVDYFFIDARNELDLMPFVAGLLALAFGATLWRSLLQSDLAQAQAEAAALRERQSAAAAAAAKSDTIRRMNDELRTPMMAMAGAAEQVRRAAVSPETRRDASAMVQAGAVLARVLSDLSDLDRLESGHVTVTPKASDPGELVRAVVAAFRAEAEDKGLELFLDISPETPALVEIDALRVRQILSNLVANAVRFTRHGGVRVRLQTQAVGTADRIRLGFVVADTGAGMSRSQLALVLDRERIHANGPGLGLAISLRLTRLMGAKLAGRSELGEGSVFSFVIEAPVVLAERGAHGRSAA